MSGVADLGVLLQTMQPVLHDSVFVFHSSQISFEDAVKFEPILIFKEQEGTALILKQEQADNGELDYVYPSRMITLNVHSSLDAVGFLAAITKSLAESGISVNPVSAHFHDHLFVPVEKAQDAMRILTEFSND